MVEERGSLTLEDAPLHEATLCTDAAQLQTGWSPLGHRAIWRVLLMSVESLTYADLALVAFGDCIE
jgi:hypothetical protein